MAESYFMFRLKTGLAYMLMPKGTGCMNLVNLQDIEYHIDRELGHNLKHFQEKDLQDYRLVKEFTNRHIEKIFKKKQTIPEKLMGFCSMISEKEAREIYERFKNKPCEDKKGCGPGDFCATCLIKHDFGLFLDGVKQ